MDKFLVSNLGALLEYIRRKLKVIYTVRFHSLAYTKRRLTKFNGIKKKFLSLSQESKFGYNTKNGKEKIKFDLFGIK